MLQVLDTPFIRVDVVQGLPLVRVRRTERAFPTVTELIQTFTDVNHSLDGIERSAHRLLIDTRAVAGRNDAEFEQAFAPLRARMLGGFERVAVLARSTVGTLQVKRHASEDGMDTVRPFTDEAEAMTWLADR